MDKEANIERWKGIVLESIQYIEKDKVDRKISPTHATAIEIEQLIQRRIKLILQILINDGELIEGDTINSKYYK